MVGRETVERENLSPRAAFAQNFADLYDAAGNPTLRRVATAAAQRMRATQSATTTGGASAQRISDWKAGRNVPARFESLLPVVLTLLDLARRHETPIPKQLSDIREWQRLWKTATTWTPDDAGDADCPYPGLAAYGAADRQRFFGRDRATTEFTALIRAGLDSESGIVILTGTSGAGKSSLLAAGVAPALSGWDITALTPGAEPLRALASANETSSPETSSAHRLLIVDQFEELFTLTDAEHDREEFIAALARRAAAPGSAAVLSLRADFYSQCLSYPALRAAFEHHSYPLGPMSGDELAQAISGPAQLTGLELEPGLEELVITELCGVGDQHDRSGYEPGALPLLSHVMAATWQHRTARRLTIAGYRKAGGVSGSVTETAENAWTDLTAPQQTAARHILLGLVTATADARDTRRTATRSELVRHTADPDAAETALETLSRTRLLTLDAESVYLTHEIVLRAWPRLRSWIDADRVGHLLRQRLETDAAEWDSAGHDASLLYRGARLHTVLDQVDPAAAGELPRAFLAAATDSRTRARRQSTTRKAVLALLGVILLILGITAYTQTRFGEKQRDDKNFAAILAEADRLRDIDPTIAAQLYVAAARLRPGDQEVRARLLATENTPLATAFAAHDEGLRKIAYRPDGKLLATASNDNTIRLWDVSDPRRPQAVGEPFGALPDASFWVGFSPDGRTLATTGATQIPQLWDVSEPARPRQLNPASGTEAGELAYSGRYGPTGRTLAVASTGGPGVLLWDVGNPAAPKPGPILAAPGDGAVRAFTFAATGSLFAITSIAPGQAHSKVELWTVTEPTIATRVGPTLEVPLTVWSMEFTPDGTMLALNGIGDAERFGSAPLTQLWRVTDPEHPRSLESPLVDHSSIDRPTPVIAFSPDGRTLATGGAAGARLWNITDPARPTPLGNPLGAVPVRCLNDARVPTRCIGEPTSLAFSSDGRTLAVGGTEGTVRLWSLAPTDLTGHTGWSGRPRFSADGARMLTESDDGRVIVWDTSDPGVPRRLTEVRVPPGSFVSSIDAQAQRVAIRNQFGSATQIFDLTNPDSPVLLTEWNDPTRQRLPVTMRRDWRLMVTTSTERGSSSVQLWDISDPVHPKPSASIPTDSLLRAAFSPNGTILALTQWTNADEAAASGAFTMQTLLSMWDVSNPDHPIQLGEAHRMVDPAGDRSTPPFGEMTFHPDNRTLLTWGNETLQLWDISDPAAVTPLGDPIRAHELSIMTADFSADGSLLVTSGSDRTIRLWNTTDRRHLETVTGPIVTPDTAAWLVAFHPAGGFLAGASSEGTRRLWKLDWEYAIDRICGIAGDSMTPELWNRYLPDVPYQATCG
ncbi:hypothetical protein JK358_11820 [Nocardia sp. 2]|uniref:Novel STAND NTPase 1 domain-containing protein n=1 Tax=Nocardia acididurans TaxID=2802282 RepID=A0ABS1M422_9NOCA|nr:hypothetical protein [Nocardia acididurans]MBL1075081.1 hypothetical protein [Nocardia acididurans]